MFFNSNLRTNWEKSFNFVFFYLKTVCCRKRPRLETSSFLPVSQETVLSNEKFIVFQELPGIDLLQVGDVMFFQKGVESRAGKPGELASGADVLVGKPHQV